MTTSKEQQQSEAPERGAGATTVDLVESLARLRQEPAWLDGQDRTLVLTQSASMRVVLRALHAGSALGTHQADGQISVQVLEGRIEFVSGGRTIEMTQGHVLVLAGGAPHSLRAIDESAILITLAVDRTR